MQSFKITCDECGFCNTTKNGWFHIQNLDFCSSECLKKRQDFLRNMTVDIVSAQQEVRNEFAGRIDVNK